MSAAESLGEKRNSFVFPLTKISRRFICNTGGKNNINTGTLGQCMRNAHQMERDTNNCPTCRVKRSQVGKAQRFKLMSFLIGNRRRIWRPWGASFRRINSHLSLQLPPHFSFISLNVRFFVGSTFYRFTGSLSPLSSLPSLLGSFLFVWTYALSYDIIHEITTKVLSSAGNKEAPYKCLVLHFLVFISWTEVGL